MKFNTVRLIKLASWGSVGRAGTPNTEAVPSAAGSNPPVANTPVSAPEQDTGIRSGVGPQRCTVPAP